MTRIAELILTTLSISLSPILVQAQSEPRQDSSVAIIDSLRPKVIPRRVNAYRPQSRSCHGFSQRTCSVLGALMFGSLGYLAADASTPSPRYEYRPSLGDPSLFDRKVCVEHCGFIGKAIVFSVSGATVGGIGGWIVGRK